MATKQETIVLNDYDATTTSIRRRTSARGKVSERVTVDIKSEPLVHMFDDAALGAGPAQVIRNELEKAIKGITTFAHPNTIKRRNYAKAAMESGQAPKSVRKRYSGGRIGTKLPKGSARLFNDSDRLSEGLFVRQVQF